MNFILSNIILSSMHVNYYVVKMHKNDVSDVFAMKSWWIKFF